METQQEYHYTYYSYEECGRGYFGSRTCKCLPEKDAYYFGSFKDKTFKPTQKIILKSDYATREEAYADEIILQQYYKVIENPHFANRAYQTSTKFYLPTEEKKKIGKMVYEKLRQEGRGLPGLTDEEKRKISLKAVESNRVLRRGIYSLTKEQMVENGKKLHQEGKGIFSLSKEEKIEAGKKGGTVGGNSNKINKTGFCGRSKEKMIEDGRKGGKISGKISGKLTYQNRIGIHGLSPEQTKQNASKGGKIVSSQRWKCLETGFISTAGALGNYQKARGIDTSQRVRVE